MFKKPEFEILPAGNVPVSHGHASSYSERGFWRKLVAIAGRASRKLLVSALTLFHCLQDHATPRWAKGVIMGALGYLILPVDAIPDFIPVIGLADDWAVIVAALATVAVYVRDEHKARAREQVARVLGRSAREFSQPQ